jgi:hypothetical protein
MNRITFKDGKILDCGVVIGHFNNSTWDRHHRKTSSVGWVADFLHEGKRKHDSDVILKNLKARIAKVFK